MVGCPKRRDMDTGGPRLTGRGSEQEFWLFFHSTVIAMHVRTAKRGMRHLFSFSELSAGKGREGRQGRRRRDGIDDATICGHLRGEFFALPRQLASYLIILYD